MKKTKVKEIFGKLKLESKKTTEEAIKEIDEGSLSEEEHDKKFELRPEFIERLERIEKGKFFEFKNIEELRKSIEG